jgi:hypothetical protein
MIMPDGTVLEGFFSNNTFQGPHPPEGLDEEVIVEEI